MYGVKPNVVKANGVKVNVLRGKVVNGNSDLRVQAGTTGFRADPGQAADVRGLVDICFVRGDFQFLPVEDENSNIVGIRIICNGNDELMSLMEALAFAARATVNQCLVCSDC